MTMVTTVPIAAMITFLTLPSGLINPEKPNRPIPKLY